MKDEFISYLKSIGMESPMIELAMNKYEIIEVLRKSIGVHEIKDLFVEEESTDDGKRNYKNFVFLTDKYFIEVEISSMDTNISVGLLSKNLSGFKITCKDYEWGKTADAKSKLSLYCKVSELMWSLTASKENCDNLRNLIDNYVIPNLDIT